MTKFGFAQHPNEWWHFSYGDQLWAWKIKSKCPLWKNLNSIDFHLVNLIYNFHLEYL